MSYNAETYLEIKRRLNDWLRVTGGDVPVLPLDLLNRAQNKVQSEKLWSKQMQDIEMPAVDGEENTYSFPDDMVTYSFIHYDSDGDGKPDEYFYNEGRIARGYREVPTFSKSGGHGLKAKFFLSPDNAPRVRYQKKLSDFENDEQNTQYSFFPGELLVRAAQVIHIEETGLTGVAVQAVEKGYRDELLKYEANQNYVNNDLRMEILDNSGTPISTESTDLTGDFSGNDSYRGYENDVDLR